jgi:hypothetical protein
MRQTVKEKSNRHLMINFEKDWLKVMPRHTSKKQNSNILLLNYILQKRKNRSTKVMWLIYSWSCRS